MKDVTMICNYVAVILLTLASQSNCLYAMGMGPLHESEKKGNAEMVQILIDNGVDCNIETISYETPLHWAVKHRNIGAMRLLIENEADINATNFLHETPLHIAADVEDFAEVEDFYAIQLLIKNCADINRANGNYITPRDYVSLVLKSAHCATQESRLAGIEDEKKRLELMQAIVNNQLEAITKREIFETIAYMFDHPDEIESIFLTIAMKSARSRQI